MQKNEISITGGRQFILLFFLNLNDMDSGLYVMYQNKLMILVSH